MHADKFTFTNFITALTWKPSISTLLWYGVKVSIFQKELIISVDGELGMFDTHFDVVYVLSWCTRYATTFRK